jgi:hypothetical protein
MVERIRERIPAFPDYEPRTSRTFPHADAWGAGIPLQYVELRKRDRTADRKVP